MENITPGTVDLKTGRVAVTVAAFALMDDAYGYWYSREADECGMECWSLVDGADALSGDDQFDVWFASGACKQVSGDALIFVSAKDALKAAP